AERSLQAVEGKAQFPILLLTLITNRTADMATRQAGSVFFKNFIRRRWPLGETDQLHAEDRQAIRSNIVDMMVSLEPILQTQIGESLAIIAQADFPARWPDLINVMVSKFSSTDFNVNVGILQTAHYIFSRWEGKFETNELYTEINLVLEHFCEPLLRLLVRTDELIDASAGDLRALNLLMRAMELQAMIFQDLSSKDLPPFMEDNMAQFMQIWHKYLTYTNPVLEADADEDHPGPMEMVRTAICGIVELYTIKYGEDFPMVTQFIDSIWKLLSTTGKDARFDGLVGKSMAFLTVVIKLRSQQALFQDPEVKRQLLEKIVLPNLEIRPSDEEGFEDEPLLYVRKDVEGADGDSRRKGAADMVRGLLEAFPVDITQIASSFMTQCLTLYEANPTENWRQKDTALALLTAVSSTGISGVSHGVSSTSELFDIGNVYDQYVLGDLRAPGESIPYLLQVDAIRYLLAYRRQLGRERLLVALPALLTRLTSLNTAVHTYAAFGVERLLLEPTFRPTEKELQPMVEALIIHPFRLLLPDGPTGPAPPPQKLAENEYPMRLILRIIQTLRAPGIGPYVESTFLPNLVQILSIIAQNPSNPKFTHYTFEAMCSVITLVCQEKPETVTAFETALEHVSKAILVQGVLELTPYVLQLLSLTLNVHVKLPGVPLPDMYQGIFPSLLQPVAWESHANIPALTMIIRAYLRVDHAAIVSNNQFEAILGIFQKLIASRMNDHYAFDLLETLADAVPWEVMSKYWKPIFTLLLKR
ncbi:Cse1-domain-containing protein, partial [Piptocephalis cylindrospora]